MRTSIVFFATTVLLATATVAAGAHRSGGIKAHAHRGKVIVKAAHVNEHASRAVTVQELFALNHRLDVPAGTRVAWADPHFERVWFPTSGPAVVRQDGVLTTLFETPGEYHGRFIVTAGHATTDVYTITVVVGAPRQ
jgi:hypothetical protein